MSFKDVWEYQQPMDTYFRKFDAEGYGNALVDMQEEVAGLMANAEQTAEQDKRLSKLEKTLKNTTRKDLSPSGGVTVGVPVRMDDGSLQVVYLATDDARDRGLRMSFNGTADAKETFHQCRTRELQEELHHHPFFNTVFANLEKADPKAHIICEENKATIGRLKQCKFMYVTQQMVFIDTSKIYTEAGLRKGLTEVNQSMAFLQGLVKNFFDFKFSKEPTAKQIEAVQNALLIINAYKGFSPFTSEERASLQILGDELKDFSQDAHKACCVLIENSVMRYTEAKGICPTTAADLHKKVSGEAKASGVFGPNYDMFKKLYDDRVLQAYEMTKIAEVIKASPSLFTQHKSKFLAGGVVIAATAAAYAMSGGSVEDVAEVAFRK